MIRSWLFASLVAFSLAFGCGGKQSAPPPPPPGGGSGSAAVDPPAPTDAKPAGKDANVELKALADASCACKDAACAKGAVDNFITWVNSHKDAQGDEAQAEADTKRLLECAQKAGLSQDDLAAMLKKLDL